MTTKTSFLAFCSLVVSTLTATATLWDAPHPLPSHPGNVFLAGENIVLSLPQAGEWKLLDYDKKVVVSGSWKEAILGKLPVGYFELIPLSNGVPSLPRITLGVVKPLSVPTPKSSPIGIDVAMAWFYSGDQMKTAANLCTLAGVNWVRDRLRWDAMEPSKGQFSSTNIYDDTARIQSKAGLRVLQVHHNTPKWAGTNTAHQPLDLRDAYNFMREMAKRWKGQIVAFEPWNEADIEMFGGHAGVEMASLQKASYLGLKAGNPDVIACMNVFATPQKSILEDFHANEASAYFDTFNLHHYCPLNRFPSTYASFRSVSDGKPLWVTEFNVPVQWEGPDQEPTDENLRVQAERVPEVFAAALHEGPEAVFYFMLPHYCEGQTQFGILHRDLTPRPAYLALAAVGRILADAKPLGKLQTTNSVQAYVFKTWFQNVIVAWANEGVENLTLSTAPIGIYDLLGRPVENTTTTLKLTHSPLYVVLSDSAVESLKLAASPKPLPLKNSHPSPVVLQLAASKERLALNLSAWRVSSEKNETLPVVVYNFSDHKVQGKLTLQGPKDWTVQLPESVEIAPGERQELALTMDCHTGASGLVNTVKITGDFGADGQAVLSVRISPTPFKLREGSSQSLTDVLKTNRWQPLFSKAKEQSVLLENKSIHVKATLEAGDRWAYPILTLKPLERPAANTDALIVTLTAQAGEATYRLIVDEDNGSSYAIDFIPQPKPGQTVEAIAVLSAGTHGDGWSQPDDNGKLDPDKIKSLKIGGNPSGETIDYSFKNLRWVKLANP